MTGTGDTDAVAFLRMLGKRVRLLRLGQERTQEQLADAAGMSRSFVSLIEKGAHGVDVVRLYRLAAALDIPLAELLDPPSTTARSDRRCCGQVSAGETTDSRQLLDPDDGDRRVARVVLTMPDFVADGLAHLVVEANRAAAIFGSEGFSGIDGWRPADSLYAAATCGRYECPDGGLLPRHLYTGPIPP